MTLAWYDRVNSRVIMRLPRKEGEGRVEYTRRFFNDIRGLGRIGIVTVRGRKPAVRLRAVRGW